MPLSMTSSPNHMSHPSYRPDIDGLRAIAVLSVVAFHAFPNWVKGGFIGVDIFFVISGFLISTIIFKSLERGTFSFSEFYARRIKRIFPALLIVLIASLVFGWFALLSPEYKQLGKHVAASAGFIQNFVLWGEDGYFDNTAESKPLLHIWSLGVEEQFYILWPLLLWVAWKKNFNFVTIIIVILTLSFYLNIIGVKKDSVATFYFPQTRFWELLCGSILAWINVFRKDDVFYNGVKLKLDKWLSILIFQKRIDDGKTLSNTLSVLGVSFIIYGLLQINKEFSFPGYWALIPVFGAVLLISAGPQAWVNRTLLSNKIAVWFGLISYPLYLWHWPLLSFLRIIEEVEPSISFRIAAILLAVILASLTYYFVEQPIRKGQHNKLKVFLLVFISLAIFITGIYTYYMKGFPLRKEISRIENVELLFKSPYTGYDTFSCEKYFTSFDISSLSKLDGGCVVLKPEEPSTLFIGDSHSIHYANSLSQAKLSENIAIIQGNNCLPFSGENYMKGEKCHNSYSDVISFLNNDKKINAIFLSSFWAKSVSGKMTIKGINWRLADDATNNDIQSFLMYGRKLLKSALENNRKVVFMRDIPILDFDIKRCFNYRPLRITEKENFIEECSVNYSAYKNRNKKVLNAIDILLSEFPDVQVYDPKELLCDQTRCKLKKDDKPIYYNGDHVNVVGGNLIISDMVSKGLIR